MVVAWHASGIRRCVIQKQNKIRRTEREKKDRTKVMEEGKRNKNDVGWGRSQTQAGSCHVRQKFDQSLREVRVGSIGDLRSACGTALVLALFEDASERGPASAHFWPGVPTLTVDAVRNTPAGALGCGERPRANAATATAVREQARGVRERGRGRGGGGYATRRAGVGAGAWERLEKEEVEARVGVGSG